MQWRRRGRKHIAMRAFQLGGAALNLVGQKGPARKPRAHVAESFVVPDRALPSPVDDAGKPTVDADELLMFRSHCADLPDLPALTLRWEERSARAALWPTSPTMTCGTCSSFGVG